MSVTGETKFHYPALEVWIGKTINPALAELGRGTQILFVVRLRQPPTTAASWPLLSLLS